MGGPEGAAMEKAGKSPGGGPVHQLMALSAPTSSCQPELSGQEASVPQEVIIQHTVHCTQENSRGIVLPQPNLGGSLTGGRGLGWAPRPFRQPKAPFG